MTDGEKLDLSNEGNRAIIRDIAFEVADKIAADLKEHFAAAIKLHQADCPVKIEVAAIVNQAKGGRVAIAALAAFVAAVVGALWTAITWAIEHGK